MADKKKKAYLGAEISTPWQIHVIGAEISGLEARTLDIGLGLDFELLLGFGRSSPSYRIRGKPGIY